MGLRGFSARNLPLHPAERPLGWNFGKNKKFPINSIIQHLKFEIIVNHLPLVLCHLSPRFKMTNISFSFWSFLRCQCLISVSIETFIASIQADTAGAVFVVVAGTISDSTEWTWTLNFSWDSFRWGFRRLRRIWKDTEECHVLLIRLGCLYLMSWKMQNEVMNFWFGVSLRKVAGGTYLSREAH